MKTAMVVFFESWLDEDGNMTISALDVTFPPPWFVPVEAPPCNECLEVPADETNDGVARTFYCDRVLGHTERSGYPGKHRQVTDADSGFAVAWPVHP